jgi:hypothetical protein
VSVTIILNYLPPENRDGQRAPNRSLAKAFCVTVIGLVVGTVWPYEHLEEEYLRLTLWKRAMFWAVQGTAFFWFVWYFGKDYIVGVPFRTKVMEHTRPVDESWIKKKTVGHLTLL